MDEEGRVFLVERLVFVKVDRYRGIKYFDLVVVEVLYSLRC